MTVRNLAQKRARDGHSLKRGEIHSETVPSLFHQLFRTRATGVLTVTQRQFSKRVDFEAGYVLFAASNDRDDRLNQRLLSTEAISLKNLLRCLDAYSLHVTGDTMVLEGVRSITSWARVYEEVGGLNTEYLATGDAPAIMQGLPLLPEERGLLTMCRTPTSLAEMCEASRLKDYDVCKSIWGLLLVGALMKS